MMKFNEEMNDAQNIIIKHKEEIDVSNQWSRSSTGGAHGEMPNSEWLWERYAGRKLNASEVSMYKPLCW